MSNISVLGETLLSFIKPYFPEFVENFCPGISRFTIQSSLIGLDQALPGDFYQLYEWKNGTPDCFPQLFNSGDILEFSPIELVLEEMKWNLYVKYGDVPPTYKGCCLLPFIKIDSDAVVVALGRTYPEEAHIVYVDEVGECHLYCDSITSMMTSTVECFAAGSVTISNEGDIQEDYHLSSEIWRRNNPHTLAEAILELTSSINICTSEEPVMDREYSIALDSLTSALATLRRFRPPEVIKLIQSNLVQLKKVNIARGGGLHLSLNEWLRAVE
ncbi:hypothetical protein IFO70_32405 [Phormidium tenue FACHB-886]|nr:hypothetical protein [Phormidium tenue FACHB-886]